jgi:hypothetical protein
LLTADNRRWRSLQCHITQMTRENESRHVVVGEEETFLLGSGPFLQSPSAASAQRAHVNSAHCAQADIETTVYILYRKELVVTVATPEERLRSRYLLLSTLSHPFLVDVYVRHKPRTAIGSRTERVNIW